MCERTGKVSEPSLDDCQQMMPICRLEAARGVRSEARERRADAFAQLEDADVLALTPNAQKREDFDAAPEPRRVRFAGKHEEGFAAREEDRKSRQIRSYCRLVNACFLRPRACDIRL